MAYEEPRLPLDVKSALTIGLEQIAFVVNDWLSLWAGADAVPHPGIVTNRFLKEQSGRSIRSIIAHVRGEGIRYAGGAMTNDVITWLWFLVIPGTLQNRTVDASTVVGEGMRLVTATPWQDLEAVAATGTARFTGTPGSAVPLGLVLNRNTGAQYATTVADVIGAGGSADIPVEAVEVGAHDNSRANRVALTIDGAPPAGVDVDVTVIEPGLSGGQWPTVFCKTPVAGTMRHRPLYKDPDEELGTTIWEIRWDQEIDLGTAQRMRTPAPDVLTTVLSTSTLPSTPNDGEFTQIVEE